MTRGESVNDEVLAQRARVERWTGIGKRIGYGLFLVAVVLFVIGFVVGFRPSIVTPIVAAMVIGSIILLPAIVFGYGVKAADREERGGGTFH